MALERGVSGVSPGSRPVGPGGDRTVGRLWGGGNERQQRSIGSVLDSGGLLGRILPRRVGGGGPGRAKGGQKVLPLRRGTGRGSAGHETADPLWRLRLPLPAAWAGGAVNGSVAGIGRAFFILAITGGITAVIAPSTLRAHH